ncbi:hypothetical protein [Patulibacter defluvii]|uniref:hypothetical protein n=1 Tax=Patulibacter defluvii TaxID=3095358 RepID=UPI002A74BEAE|nr:hypothetical protein [Patulibacter sp. DM4]
MLRVRTIAALTAAALLGPAAAAEARTVHADNIVSPTKLIRCYAVQYGGGIECSASYLRRIGELDPYIALKPRGRARYGERGDYPGYTTARRTLHYGDRWQPRRKARGISCTIRSASGLTCRNRDGHGFVLVNGGVRRF